MNELEQNRKELVNHIYYVIKEQQNLIKDKLVNIIDSHRMEQLIENKQYFLILETISKGTGQGYYRNITGLEKYDKKFTQEEIEKINECIDIIKEMKKEMV